MTRTRRSVLAGAAAAAAGTLGFPTIVRAAEKVTLITPFGFADVKDPAALYTNEYLDKI
jgi:hypothetical protein